MKPPRAKILGASRAVSPILQENEASEVHRAIANPFPAEIWPRVPHALTPSGFVGQLHSANSSVPSDLPAVSFLVFIHTDIPEMEMLPLAWVTPPEPRCPTFQQCSQPGCFPLLSSTPISAAAQFYF